LRSLEYSQRLAQRARNVLAVAGGSTGQALYEAALAGGTQALGLPDAGLRAGTRADLVTLDREHPALAGRSGAERLDAWIFATHRAVDGVWVGGRKLVAEGRHQAREAVAARFRRVMEDLARA
jgi:cytosine/adenosine deaminase-related metal-dependent hydrolase